MVLKTPTICLKQKSLDTLRLMSETLVEFHQLTDIFNAQSLLLHGGISTE